MTLPLHPLEWLARREAGTAFRQRISARQQAVDAAQAHVDELDREASKLEAALRKREAAYTAALEAAEAAERELDAAFAAEFDGGPAVTERRWREMRMAIDRGRGANRAGVLPLDRQRNEARIARDRVHEAMTKLSYHRAQLQGEVDLAERTGEDPALKRELDAIETKSARIAAGLDRAE